MVIIVLQSICSIGNNTSMDNKMIAKIISAMSDVFDRAEMTEEEKRLCDMGIAIIAMMSQNN